MKLLSSVSVLAAGICFAYPAIAQTAGGKQGSSAAAPSATASVQSQTPQPAERMGSGNSAQTQGLPTAPAPNIQNLTLQDAERIAIQNHPQVQIAIHQAAYAQAQLVEAKSAYYPQAAGNATGVESENQSRIDAGGLNAPRVFDKFANGVTLTQLITDFGHTHEIVKSANLHAKAQEENVVTSRADVLLAVDAAYFSVLKSQALLQVADQTVKSRQLVADQITTMAQNKLKSGLDVSFAQVDLAQAKLLLIQAQNDLQASFAQLSAALGYPDQHTYNLTETAVPPAPPADFTGVLQQAFMNRPELISQRFDVNSAQSYATAERDLWFPTLSGAGVAGIAPFRAPNGTAILPPRYAAAGFNLNIPIFNGRLFNALHAQALEQFRTQQQYLRDLEDRIARDVHMAWLSANSGFERLAVTEQLLNQATQAYNLADARYRMQLSSIVELTQAQLNLTQAQIQEASAKYDYETEISNLNYQTGLLH